MAPRRRKEGNDRLPENLYRNGNYFKYRNPQTRKETGLGCDESAAKKAANKLNAILMMETDLVRKVLGTEGKTWATLVDRFKDERQEGEGKKKSTTENENYRLARIKKDFGNIHLDDTTQTLLSDWLDKNFKGNPHTKHRGTLIKLMAFGIAKGMFKTGTLNLAASTLLEAKTKKVRKVLTIEQYKAIHEISEPWLQVALDFALITLQRLGDVVKARYSDIKDDELFIIQNKTEKHGDRAYLRIQIGPTLKQVIARSRTGVCPFIVHRKPERTVRFEGQEHPWQILGQYLSRAFNDARDKTGLFNGWAKGTPPTFHEIRALGGAQYLAQGYSKEYVNLLMGHTTQKMTDTYTEQHQNWTLCAAELKL